MKYKRIKKLAGGGFATFTPVVSAPPVTPVRPTQKQEQSSEAFGSKDVYKQLIHDGGLVNDVNAFISELIKVEQSPFSNSESRASILQTFAKINEIRSNQDQWTNAHKQADSNGGLGETAIDVNGGFFVHTKDGIKKISFDAYDKMKDKPRVMTVSELLEARRYLPELTNDRHIFTVAEGSIGMQKITDHIQKMTDLLSENSLITENHYSKAQLAQQLKMLTGQKPSAEVTSALQELGAIINTPGEYVKVHAKDASKRKNIKKALRYIWGTLGTPAQLKLKGVSLLNGEKDPTKYLQDMLISFTEPEIERQYTPESQSDIDGSANTSNIKSLTQFQAFHKDKLADPLDKFAFNDTTLGILFRGAIGGSGPLLTEDDKVIPMTTLNTIVNKLGLSKIVNPAGAYFGEKPIDIYSMDDVIYDGRDVAKVYMPVTESGNPDYEEFKHFKTVYKHYEQIKNTASKQEIEDLFLKNGYNVKINDKKVMVESDSVKPFLIMYGYTNDATNLTKDNNFIKRLTSDEEDLIVPKLEQIWTVGTGKNKVNMTPDGWFGEDYYKGIVAIPYRKAATAFADMAVGQGAKDHLATIAQVQRNVQANPIVGNGDASVLTQK